MAIISPGIQDVAGCVLEATKQFAILSGNSECLHGEGLKFNPCHLNKP